MPSERPQALASLMECPTIPGDLVDLLTRNGTFAFLEDLHETGRLWELRNFRIPLVPHGAASRDFGDSLKAILALAERYPHNPSPYISSGHLPNSSQPFLCPARDAASPDTSHLMRVAFRKGNGSPSGIRPSNTTTASKPIRRRS